MAEQTKAGEQSPNKPAETPEIPTKPAETSPKVFYGNKDTDKKYPLTEAHLKGGVVVAQFKKDKIESTGEVIQRKANELSFIQVYHADEFEEHCQKKGEYEINDEVFKRPSGLFEILGIDYLVLHDPRPDVQA